MYVCSFPALTSTVNHTLSHSFGLSALNVLENTYFSPKLMSMSHSEDLIVVVLHLSCTRQHGAP